MLTHSETIYYHRHLILSGFGPEAQAKLKNSHVFVVGAGGLGCPALLYLAGAGVGKITIVDADVVQENNLHRQILYTMEDVGLKKVDAAKMHLNKLNPYIQINTIPERITEGNIARLMNNIDLVIDASDNFDTRFLLGDYTCGKKIPLVFAAISGFEGQLTVFNYKDGRTFRDLFPTMPKEASIRDCATNGVIGFVPGILGCLQAAEALKIVTGIGTVMSGKLMVIDLLSMDKKEFAIPQSTSDSLSEDQHTIYNATNTLRKMIDEINARELKDRLDHKADDLFLLDVREPFEFDQFNIGGVLVPLRDLPGRLNEIPFDKEIVVVCKSGVRSLKAAQYMAENRKDSKIFNLKGGLLSWVSEIGTTKE